MDFKDLIALYFERSNALEGLWGFYITVVLGLMAYFGTTRQSRQKTLLAVVVSFGFAGFAWVNLSALLEVTQERQAAQTLIVNYIDPDLSRQRPIDAIKTSIHPSGAAGLKYFHIASDAAVLVGLWVLTLYREEK